MKQIKANNNNTFGSATGGGGASRTQRRLAWRICSGMALISLVLCAVGVVGVEFVLGIIFASVQALTLLAPVPQLAAANPDPAPPLDPGTEDESEAEAEDAA